MSKEETRIVGEYTLDERTPTKELIKRINQLYQTFKETQDVLKLVEWMEIDPDPFPVYHECPFCHEHKEESSYYGRGRGHSPTCQLSNLINKINSILNPTI